MYEGRQKWGKSKWMDIKVSVCKGIALSLLFIMAMDGIQENVKARMRSNKCNIDNT